MRMHVYIRMAKVETLAGWQKNMAGVLTAPFQCFTEDKNDVSYTLINNYEYMYIGAQFFKCGRRRSTARVYFVKGYWQIWKLTTIHQHAR